MINDGVTDYGRALQDMTLLTSQLHTIHRIIERITNMDSAGNFQPLIEAIEAIDTTRGNFVQTHPAMTQIWQCREMDDMIKRRVAQCRELLAIAQTLPAATMTEEECNALADHCPDEDEVCSICCDGDKDQWLKLPCNHAFHSKCAKQWLTQRRRTCPLCRQLVIPV